MEIEQADGDRIIMGKDVDAGRLNEIG